MLRIDSLEGFLARLFADQAVAKATVEFLLQNKKKFLLAHPSTLPQVCSRLSIAYMRRFCCEGPGFEILSKLWAPLKVQFFPLILKIAAWGQDEYGPPIPSLFRFLNQFVSGCGLRP